MTADFHALKEYDYASVGMNELLSRGAGIFKATTGRNSKMLFVFNSEPAFDSEITRSSLCKSYIE